MAKSFYNGAGTPFPIAPNEIERLAAPWATTEFQYFRGISQAHYQDYNRVGIKIFDAGGDVLCGYGSVLQQYYADSRGAMIVYDAHDPNAFDRVRCSLPSACVSSFPPAAVDGSAVAGY